MTHCKMAERDGINYYDGMTVDVVTVPLTSGDVVLRRAGVGDHFHLRWLGMQIAESPIEERVRYFARFLEVGGVTDAQDRSFDELVVLTAEIKKLNAVRGRLAWDSLKSDLETNEKTTDYVGRETARIVNVLARSYGWSRQEILELPPEVALAHMQECVIDQHRERAWQHSLSEIAWEYSKTDKKSHYKPLPPLEWDRDIPRKHYRPVPQEIKDKYYPKGVIIDLTKRGNGSKVAGRSPGDPADN